MSIPEFAPPLTPAEGIVEGLGRDGFVVACGGDVAALSGGQGESLARVARDWDDMPVDPYLRDGGHYRRRRHASFLVSGARAERVAHRAHFQSPEYNALHGGMERWFEPMGESLTSLPVWSALLVGLGRVCSAVRPTDLWSVEAHQFRIDTSEGIGRPTPEGAHRDGVDFVALFLIGRHRIRGGETRVFTVAGPQGIRFTMSEPWSVLLLDDVRMIHESTPIQPLLGAAAEGASGYRDTLVVTFRRDGFQALAR